MRFASLAVALAALVAAPTTTNAQNSKAFKYRSYSEIVDTILSLETKFPQFVEVFTAQDRYGLPVRSELQCTRKGVQQPCLHYVIKITDEASLPDPERPEVFFSGALHGDERVGPQAVTSLAELLVDHASRPDGNPWIKRLVKTRTVVIMPTTNSYGYDHNNRLELFVDPNRDFNYITGWSCFHSMVARAVNEVWRAHMFQLAVTFHAGEESISYQWGSPNHQLPDDGGSEKSPDDQGQFYVGLGLSRFGGKFQQNTSVPYYYAGPMNDVVYPVNGGMEDWGYAASWENEFTTPKPIGVCEPKTFGGYPAEKSVYNNATHRAFNILIETSSDKQPAESALGDSATLSDAALADFLPESQTVGHVPRNVRIALMYIDLVQPYGERSVARTHVPTGDHVPRRHGNDRFQQNDSNPYYATGSMNDIVYATRGGMEDWAYAGSWEDEVTEHSDSEPNVMGKCQPRSFGGYPKEKSVYNNATHRAFNILIETSNEKQPPESDLGDSTTLSDAALADFLPESQTVGHVPRNVRLALMYIDVVQPYVTWKVSPSTGRAGAAMSFTWEVQGAFTVDKTQLRISKTPDFATVETTAAQNGVTRWYHPDMKTASGSAATNKGLFKHDVTFLAPGVYYVQAVATVDQDWQTQGTGKDLPSPNVKPQTHVVNARTNPNWFYSHNGRTVQGRLE